MDGMKKTVRFILIAVFAIVCCGFSLSDFDLSQLAAYEKPYGGQSFTACKISGENYGINKTYEDYTLIDYEGSAQYQYIKAHMTVDPKTGLLYDEDGFIGVALGYNFGNIGSRYYMILDTGNIIPVIKIDAKASKDASDGCKGNNEDLQDVIEFVIDTEKAKKFFGSSNGYASNGNFNNYKYFRGNIKAIEKVPGYSVTSKYDGWVTEGNNKYYYIDQKKHTGWLKDNGKWYYFDKEGIMQKGWLKDNGKWYYLNTDGTMAVGWKKVNSEWYYLNGSGAMATGWIKQGNTWYFLKSSGAMATGWQAVGNTWYYFDTDGRMLTGWQKVGKQWYYMNPSGSMATGWKKINGTWYYLNPSGSMKTGWLKKGDTWYYLKGSGAMATGWQQVGNHTYYFNDSGAMVTGVWQIGEHYYYFNSSGAMTTGWQKIRNRNGDTKWYYMNEKGEMQAGWIEVDGKSYYLNPDGSWNEEGNPEE